MHYNSALNYTLLNNTTFGGHQVIKFLNIGNGIIISFLDSYPRWDG